MESNYIESAAQPAADFNDDELVVPVDKAKHLLDLTNTEVTGKFKSKLQDDLRTKIKSNISELHHKCCPNLDTFDNTCNVMHGSKCDMSCKYIKKFNILLDSQFNT
jgi:hypothetical protein